MEPWQPLTTLLLVNLGLLFANFVDSHQTPQPTLTPAPAPAPAPAPTPPVWAPHLSPRISSPIPITNSVRSEHRAGTGNMGKKIGFIFAGIVVIMQVAVMGFLGFKRKQILNLSD